MPPLKLTVTDRSGFQGSTSMPRGDYWLQIWGKGSEKLWDEQEKERIFCDFCQYGVNMWYIRSSYGVPILTLSLSCDYPPIIFRLWCDTNSGMIAGNKHTQKWVRNAWWRWEMAPAKMRAKCTKRGDEMRSKMSRKCTTAMKEALAKMRARCTTLWGRNREIVADDGCWNTRA